MTYKINFDRELIAKFQTNIPRYTSYPTADRFSYDFVKEKFLQQLEKFYINSFSDTQVSLYIHIPFCNTLCLFCGCNKIITNDRENITKYLSYLFKELYLYFELLHHKKLNVVQLHFGGGSPSWLLISELASIMYKLKDYFNLDTAEEIAIEIDPRHCNKTYIKELKSLGFNRLSFGVQDFDKQVQKKVNRIQSIEQVSELIYYAKELGYKSTNIDLIYGLPKQTLETFTSTIDEIIKITPDRIALYHYAHIPALVMPQTRINEIDLPNSAIKLDILQMAVNKFLQANYVYIGMDHFALNTDSLAYALNNNSLHRNFQGYSTFADTNMLSFGVSAIGNVNNNYYQNTKNLDDYYRFLNDNQLPIFRGLNLNDDDLLRQKIIQEIMCKFVINFDDFEKKYNIVFNEYFHDELIELNKIQQLDLINIYNRQLIVTSKGRFLIRNIAAIFDKYLKKIQTMRYSKAI